jgi:hypothetical protein
MVGEGFKNHDSRLALGLKHKGNPCTQFHTVHSLVFWNTHLLYCNGELGH